MRSLSDLPTQLATPPGSEQKKLEKTWLLLSVSTEFGRGRSSVIVGPVVSAVDWKLTALLKLVPTLAALSCASASSRIELTVEAVVIVPVQRPPPAFVRACRPQAGLPVL